MAPSPVSDSSSQASLSLAVGARIVGRWFALYTPPEMTAVNALDRSVFPFASRVALVLLVSIPFSIPS